MAKKASNIAAAISSPRSETVHFRIQWDAGSSEENLEESSNDDSPSDKKRKQRSISYTRSKTFSGTSAIHDSAELKQAPCPLVIPRAHLQARPDSYLSAMCSGRWMTNENPDDMGTSTGSPIIVLRPLTTSPQHIRSVWLRYSASEDLVPLIQRAYESSSHRGSSSSSSSSSGSSKDGTVVLPFGLEFEDAVAFLEYYGILHKMDDAMEKVRVPPNGPAAVYLRSKLYVRELEMVGQIRDAIVKYVACHPRRRTMFVFCKESDDAKIIESDWNCSRQGQLVPFTFRCAKKWCKEKPLEKESVDCVVEDRLLQDRLISVLENDDRLEAKFIRDTNLLGHEVVDDYSSVLGCCRRLVVSERYLTESEDEHAPQEYIDEFNENEEMRKNYEDRHVLEVKIPPPL